MSVIQSQNQSFWVCRTFKHLYIIYTYIKKKIILILCILEISAHALSGSYCSYTVYIGNISKCSVW